MSKKLTRRTLAERIARWGIASLLVAVIVGYGYESLIRAKTVWDYILAMAVLAVIMAFLLYTVFISRIVTSVTFHAKELEMYFDRGEPLVVPYSAITKVTAAVNITITYKEDGHTRLQPLGTGWEQNGDPIVGIELAQLLEKASGKTFHY